MKPIILAATAAAVALSLGAGAQAHTNPYPGPELVTNGTFATVGGTGGQINYTATATGWTVPYGGYTFIFTPGTADTTGETGQYGGLSLWGRNNGGQNVLGNSPAGGNFAAIDGDFQQQPLQQTLTGVKAGATVKVQFWSAFGQQYGYDGNTLQSLSVSLGANSWTTPTTSVASHGFTGWTFDTAYLKAPTDNPTLSFSAYGNLPVPPFALVAGVGANAVPEPSTWAVMLIGLGGLGALARRRRAVSAVAA